MKCESVINLCLQQQLGTEDAVDQVWGAVNHGKVQQLDSTATLITVVTDLPTS